MAETTGEIGSPGRTNFKMRPTKSTIVTHMRLHADPRFLGPEIPGSRGAGQPYEFVSTTYVAPGSSKGARRLKRPKHATTNGTLNGGYNAGKLPATIEEPGDLG